MLLRGGRRAAELALAEPGFALDPEEFEVVGVVVVVMSGGDGVDAAETSDTSSENMSC